MQPFVIMTDYAEVHTAVESMKLGSLDYIPKQFVENKFVLLLRSILKEQHAGQSRMPVFSRDGFVKYIVSNKNLPAKIPEDHF